MTSSPSSSTFSPDQRAYKRGRSGRQTREPTVDKQKSKKTRENRKKKKRIEKQKKKTETKRGKASASTTSSLRLRQEQRGVSSNSRLHRRHLRQQSLKPVHSSALGPCITQCEGNYNYLRTVQHACVIIHACMLLCPAGSLAWVSDRAGGGWVQPSRTG